MPVHAAPKVNDRKGLFHYLITPGMYLVYKYTQYKRQQNECAKRKATEKELQLLHQKIDKLLTRIDDNDSRSSPQSHAEDEECVVCLSAKATMQTYPCGHKVVCRLCFVRTIQIAVTQRCLPLRCVVCRTKVLKLRQSRDCSPLTPPVSRHNIKLPWKRQHSNSPQSQRRSRESIRQQVHEKRDQSYPSTTASRAFEHQSRDTKRKQSHSSISNPKPCATRAMQSFLIYPEDTKPKPAFQPVSVLKTKTKDEHISIKSLKKQVRFASPIRMLFSSSSHGDCGINTLSEGMTSNHQNVKTDFHISNPKQNEEFNLNSIPIETTADIDLTMADIPNPRIIKTQSATIADAICDPVPLVPPTVQNSQGECKKHLDDRNHMPRHKILRNSAETRIPTIKQSDMYDKSASPVISQMMGYQAGFASPIRHHSKIIK